VTDFGEYEGLVLHHVERALRLGASSDRDDLLGEAYVVLLEATREHQHDAYTDRFPGFLANRLRWRFNQLARAVWREQGRERPQERRCSFSRGEYRVFVSGVARRLSGGDREVFLEVAAECLEDEPSSWSEIGRRLGRSRFAVCRSVKKIRVAVKESLCLDL